MTRGGSFSTMPTNQRLEITSLSPSHMYRHESEIRNQLKGGYLQGKIKLPKLTECTIEISAVPSQKEIEGKQLNLCPNLLFVARKKKTRAKRKRTSQASDQDYEDSQNNTQNFTIDDEPWRIVLERRGKVIHQTFPGRKAFEIECLETEKGSDYLILGQDKLMVSILTPLQRASNKGIDISSLIHAVKKNDPAKLERWSEQELKDIILKKKSVNMNEVQLRFVVRSLNGEELCSVESNPIKNTKHKSTVPLQVDEAWCRGFACIENETKFLISLKNPSSNDIKASFVLIKNGDVIMNKYLNEIKPITDVKTKHGLLIDLTLPNQQSPVMAKLFTDGYQIGIHLTRESDKNTFTDPVPVPYRLHNDSHCCSCSMTDFEYRTENNVSRPDVTSSTAHISPQSPGADSGVSSPPSFDSVQLTDENITYLTNDSIQNLNSYSFTSPVQVDDQWNNAEVITEPFDFDQILNTTNVIGNTLNQAETVPTLASTFENILQDENLYDILKGNPMQIEGPSQALSNRYRRQQREGGYIDWFKDVFMDYEEIFYKVFPLVAISLAWWLCFMDTT